MYTNGPFTPKISINLKHFCIHLKLNVVNMVACNQLVNWFVPILLFNLLQVSMWWPIYSSHLNKINWEQPYNLTKFYCCHENMVPIHGCSVISLLKEGLRGKLKISDSNSYFQPCVSLRWKQSIFLIFVCILIINRKIFNFLEVDVKNCTSIDWWSTPA